MTVLAEGAAWAAPIVAVVVAFVLTDRDVRRRRRLYRQHRNGQRALRRIQ